MYLQLTFSHHADLFQDLFVILKRIVFFSYLKTLEFDMGNQQALDLTTVKTLREKNLWHKH